MKNLSWINKGILMLNFGLTIVTFVGYALPFLAPKLFPLLSVFSLFLPLLLILNALFFLYWFLQFKKQMFISAIVLLMGMTFVNKFYKFSGKKEVYEASDFTVMSYNTRLFNLYEWIPKSNVQSEMSDFFREQNPDILCIQEYSMKNNVDFENYRYQYKDERGKERLGQGLFSKFPIINKGVIDFPNSSGNAVFMDVVKGKDTIRVYSIHLQSIKITPDVHEINENLQEGMTQDRSKRIFNRISEAFKIQQNQAEIVREHVKQSPYMVIVCGDMNNSAFSYVYRTIRGNTMNDAFEQAGQKFGKTYNFKYYPARIDYIFTDKRLKVKEFTNFSNFVNSDHFPIMTRLIVK